jgi:DNA polymerase-3 subunit delta
MPLIARTELGRNLPEISSDDGPKVFLFFGERFLCRKAMGELEKALLEGCNGTVYAIDGDTEDASQTLAKLMSYSLLPGKQIYRVNDTRLFHSKNIAASVWQKALQAYESNRLEQSAKYIGELYHLASIDKADRQPLSEMTGEQWQQLFGIEKPRDLGWTEQLHALLENSETAPPAQSDPAQRYIDSLTKGMPPNNMLILSAENVDKRKRLFTYIKNNGVVVDCSVAEGGGAAAQRVQKSVLLEMMQETLKKFDKTIEQGALDAFLERVGFHPVAVVTETEKLALYCDDHPRITVDDLNQMVGRSREDALFELTDHFGKAQLGPSLTTLKHLRENGVHGLAILATLRNYVRKLLIFKSLQLQPSPAYQRGMNAKDFQNNYLPKLKEQQQSNDILKGHPYALFMSFAKASQFKTVTLKRWLGQILDAEFHLKGSGIAEHIILEQLIITMVREGFGRRQL